MSGPATQLTHANAGRELKINKASGSHTSSLRFQSGWTGHTDMRLTAGTQVCWAARPGSSSGNFPHPFDVPPVVCLTTTENAPRMLAATALSAGTVIPVSHDAAGVAQPGDGVACLAVRRWG